MPRVRRGSNRRDRRRKVLKLAKGYRGTKSKLYRSAKESVDKALNYAYRDRRARKRDFRRLWIIRISAAARANDLTYSKLMAGLAKADVALNRKQLAEIAAGDSKAFGELASVARKALGQAAG
ncbi:MAG TPA: 50S ribosomal protein L20 [Vicinamibacteria bacterium]|nr:50S ribosomal protein L20 [Vicinamibacteria bacterium]